MLRVHAKRYAELIKLYSTSGVSVRTGTDLDAFWLVWQNRSGAVLLGSTPCANQTLTQRQGKVIE
jgi:hypothetical protein